MKSEAMSPLESRLKSVEDLLMHCVTEKQREAVELVYVEGLTKADAARAIGIDRKSLKERLEQVERRAARANNIKPERQMGKRVGIIGDTHLPYELDGYL